MGYTMHKSMRNLHSDLHRILEGRELAARSPELETNIGKLVRFTNPKGRGELGLTTWRIAGVQKTWRGELAYRIVNTAYNDTFGTIALPSELLFV